MSRQPENTFKFIDLLGKLPPCIARKKVPELLGGAIAIQTLAHADSKGVGPKQIPTPRDVVYETESLLTWLDNRMNRRK